MKILATALILTVACSVSAKTIYVDRNAAGGNDGTSWQNACNTLQHALELASTEYRPVDIHVAEGIYKPDQTKENPQGDGSGRNSFEITHGIRLWGGFPGGGGTLEERDPNKHITVLSGDLLGNDDPWVDKDTWRDPKRKDNCWYVVLAHRSTSDSLIDGFTISGGDAHSVSRYADVNRGGGIWGGGGGAVTIRNCVITLNAAQKGGGISSCRSTIVGCSIHCNYATDGGGLYECNGEISDCTISDNFASVDGGGLAYCDGTVTDSVITGNLADQGGGFYWCNAEISHSRIEGNMAPRCGGGLYSCSGLIHHCLVIGNKAKIYGGGFLYCHGSITFCTIADNYAQPIADALHSCEAYISNCIIWSQKHSLMWDSAAPVFSCIKEGCSDPSCISEDPLFIAPGYWDPNGTTDTDDDFWVSGDYHLKSQAGRWDSASWIQDDVTSPCIDTGDPMSPIGLEPFPNGGVVNMGAYGKTTESSKSYFGQVCETIVAGDINGDCIVDFRDMAIMLGHWLESGKVTPMDNPRGRAQKPDL